MAVLMEHFFFEITADTHMDTGVQNTTLLPRHMAAVQERQAKENPSSLLPPEDFQLGPWS